MSEIYCDSCSEVFEIKLKTKQDGDNQVTSFACPHCHKTYIAFCINLSIQKKKLELNDLYIELRGLGINPHNTQINRISKKIKRLRKDVKKEIDALKSHYEN